MDRRRKIFKTLQQSLIATCADFSEKCELTDDGVEVVVRFGDEERVFRVGLDVKRAEPEMTKVADQIEVVDCGENSCICCPPEKRTGMRTNGACRCFRQGNFLSLSTEERIKVRRAVMYWRNRAIEAERKLEAWENPTKHRPVEHP